MAPLTRATRSATRSAARAVLLGVVAAVALSACADGKPHSTLTALNNTTPTPTPDTTTTKAATAKATPASTTKKASTVRDRALNGTRKVVIAPIPTFESILAVDADGRLGLIDGESDTSLFVFTPVRGKYLIKTAKGLNGGDKACMSVQAYEKMPLIVVAAACDIGDGNQLFTVEVSDHDSEGEPTYAISKESAYLQVTPEGLIAQELGGAPLSTTFGLADNGAAA